MIETLISIGSIVVLMVVFTSFISAYYALGMVKMKAVRGVDEVGRHGDLDDWANENDFGYVGTYDAKLRETRCKIIAWGHRGRPTFLCRYVIKSQGNTVVTKEFVTIFGDEKGLTTSDSKDSHLYPKPLGEYMQSFTKAGIDRIWAEHIEGENYLMDVGGCQLVEQDVELEHCINESISSDAKYVLSLPLWFCRGAYWFFIRRRLWANKTIKVMHRKGMVKMPNEVIGKVV